LADEFYINYNGTQFNSIEPNICHLVYVAQVDFRKESEVCLKHVEWLLNMYSQYAHDSYVWNLIVQSATQLCYILLISWYFGIIKNGGCVKI